MPSPDLYCTLSLHDALPISSRPIPRYTGYAHVEIDLERQVLFVIDESGGVLRILPVSTGNEKPYRSEEHTSELQSQSKLVCRLLLEKIKTEKQNARFDQSTP